MCVNMRWPSMLVVPGGRDSPSLCPREKMKSIFALSTCPPRRPSSLLPHVFPKTPDVENIGLAACHSSARLPAVPISSFRTLPSLAARRSLIVVAPRRRRHPTISLLRTVGDQLDACRTLGLGRASRARRRRARSSLSAILELHELWMRVQLLLVFRPEELLRSIISKGSLPTDWRRENLHP